MVPVVYYHFWDNDKSFIYEGDGLAQHFPVLTYYARILRQTIMGVFTGNGLQIPLWDFAIGQGADIITTLNYYGVGDPVVLLAVFFPLNKMESAYIFLIIVRLYLAGVTFSMFCKEMGNARWNTLCGALAYIFCGYAFYAGVRHPFFLNPMIILPLLLLGVEKVFKKEKPYILILSVCYAAVTGVYFFYMLGILTGIYVLIRGWSFCGKDKGKDFLIYLGKLIGYVAIGILISGIIFIPTIVTFLQSTRMEQGAIVDALYGIDYYLQAPVKFLSGGSLGDWARLGYAGLAALSIFVMFSYRKKYTQLKIGFAILTSMLCIPYAGYMMNGFAYVSNRWVWGYSFLVVFIMTTMLPKIANIDTLRFKILLIMSSVYLAYLGGVLFLEDATKSISKLSKVAVTQFVIVLTVVVLSRIWSNLVTENSTKAGTKIRNNIVKVALLVTVVVNIFAQTAWHSAPQEGNYIGEFMALGNAYDRQTEVANVINAINDKGEFYRYSENAYNAEQLENNALISQVHSNSLYYSLVDKNYLEYLDEVACNDVINSGRIKGLDTRTGLNALASTKYFITETSKKDYAPYGYEELFENGRFSVFENKHALPLGYTYTNVISRADYEELDAIQKEQSMLRSVVLDEEATNAPTIAPEAIAQKRDFELECQKNVTFEDGKFKVKKKGAKASITFAGIGDSETYLVVKKLQYKAPKGKEKNITRAVIEVRDATAQEGQTMKKRLDIRTIYNQWRGNRNEYVANMGYAEQAKSEFILTFTEKGEYTFDEMNIICQPLGDYVAQVDKLREEVLENVVISTNKVNGTIDLKDNKFLCISIPYSAGWSLYVDGEKRELLRANTAYMGAEIESGHHEIELRYFTPYLKVSIIATVAGMMLLVGIVVLNKRKKGTFHD